jgi:type IV secretion system protein TrbL
MLAMMTNYATDAVAFALRLDPAQDACLQARNDRPFLGAVLSDILNGGSAESCSPSIASTVGQAIWGSQFQPFIDDAKNGVADTTKTMATFWVSIPDPNVGDATTGVPSDVVSFLQTSLNPFVGIIMIIAMIIGFTKMMYSERGGEGKAIIGMIIRYIAVSGLLVVAVGSALLVTRAGAEYVLEASTLGTHFAENLFALFNNLQGVTSAIVLFCLLLVAAAVAGIQSILMIARGGIIIVRMGVLLLTVAASNTDPGKQAFGEDCGKLLAWVIYPFVAAIVYAAGFRFMGTDTSVAGNGLLECLYGIAIITMAVFALPATMRLVVPAVAPAAGGRGVGSAVAGGLTTYIVMKSGRGAMAAA